MSLIFKNLGSKKSTSGVFDSLEKKDKVSKKIPESLSGMHLPDHYVAIPHCFSQTAIYAPRSGDRTIQYKRTDIWSQGEMNVAYDGPLLDTKIDSRLMSLVLKAKDMQKSNDNMVNLKFKETMIQLGLNPYHPNSRKKFTSSISRHLDAKFYFYIGEETRGFWKSFFVADGTTHSYEKNFIRIQLGDVIPKLFKMKDSGSFSIEDMLLNFATKSSYSSKLYSYYESNEKPFPVKVSTMLEICDKKLPEGKKPTNNHRKVLKEALDELKSLSFLNDWFFDDSKDKRDPLIVVYKRPKKDRQQNLKESGFQSNYLLL